MSDLAAADPTVRHGVRPRPFRRRSKRARGVREGLLGVGLILPAVAVLGVFTFYPFAWNFDLAAHQTVLYPPGTSKWASYHQFVQVVTSSTFFDSLRSTAIFTCISVPIALFLGLALAVAANQRRRGSAFFQVAFSSTAVTSVVVAAVIFTTFLDPNYGILPWLGFNTAPGISGSPSWALYAISGISAWQFTGFSFIIMIAGLQSLPEEVLEAARIDGANTWRVFWRVIVPLMSPTIFFGGVVGTILALQSFGVIDYLIGSYNAQTTHTNVLINYIFDEVINNNFGVAACLAIALFAITALITLAQFRILERRVHYAA